MKKTIALLRGINVGGKNILPMHQLHTLLEQLGADSIETYIQSGNVTFCNQSKLTAEDIEKTIAETFHITPKVLLLSQNDLSNAIKENPFPKATEEANSPLFL